jgi:transcriptional regulator with XRE-family HTH domain
MQRGERATRSRVDQIGVPDPVDIAVGARVRLLRKARNVSQATLADAIGVTFQQVQKYERASNRISISMLARIADTLGTNIAELVDERPADHGTFDTMAQLMNEPGVLALVQAFAKIPDGPQRRAALNLIRALAEQD